MLESRSGWIGEKIAMPWCRWLGYYGDVRWNPLCGFLIVQSFPVRQFFACQDMCRIGKSCTEYSKQSMNLDKILYEAVST